MESNFEKATSYVQTLSSSQIDDEKVCLIIRKWFYYSHFDQN